MGARLAMEASESFGLGVRFPLASGVLVGFPSGVGVSPWFAMASMGAVLCSRFFLWPVTFVP